MKCLAETHEQTKERVGYALHMDQVVLVSTLHAFGNVIDDTFHDTFQHRVFADVLATERYAANQALPKEKRKDLGYYRGPTKGAQRMSEKIRERLGLGWDSVPHSPRSISKTSEKHSRRAEARTTMTSSGRTRRASSTSRAAASPSTRGRT